jgi:hypothetical protein
VIPPIPIIREMAAMPSEAIWTAYNDPNATAEDLERVISSIYGYADIECECEGTGRIYNNADTTSGMWVPCECGAKGGE